MQVDANSVSQLDWAQVLTWISAFAAVAAAIGAIASAVVSWRVYRSQTLPSVIVYVEPDRDKGSIRLWIKNVGNGAAYDISFEVKGELPGLDRFDRGYLGRLQKDGILVLAPGSSRDTAVGLMSDSVFSEYEGQCSVSVSYFAKRGRRGSRIEDEFPLDYGSFLKTTYTDSEEHLSRKALQDIAKGVSNHTKEVVKSVGSLP